MPNSSEALRRRMLIGYLGILVVLYGMAAVLALDYPSSKAELGAAALGLLGLALAIPRPLRGWRYAVVATCVCAAPLVPTAVHELQVAQVWAVIPLMFAAIFLRTWHRASVARALAVLVAVGAAAALVMAPAEIPSLWVVLFGVCIIGAPEVFGILNASLVEAALRDPLTSVWNRAGVDREAGALIGRVDDEESRSPSSCSTSTTSSRSTTATGTPLATEYSATSPNDGPGRYPTRR